MVHQTMGLVLRLLPLPLEERLDFRGMASTILNERGWPADAIERQLAHVEGNSVRAAYNHADHLDVRRRMMQAWADLLDDFAEMASGETQGGA